MDKHAQWMDDPMVSHISKEKLEFLGELVEGGQGKSQKEMMPYMMAIMKKAKAKGITFSPADIQTIITAIRKHSSPEELARMDEIMKKASHQK